MTVNVFTASNFPLAAAPPGYYLSGNQQNPAAGSAIPAGHTSWQLLIDTTGLADAQPFATIVVQYHYTSAQLGAAGLSNQGQLTNTDGSVTQIDGGTLTGWIDDCTGTMPTSVVNRVGATVHRVSFGCDLNRIPGFYPDLGRVLILSTPGYASIPSAALNLT